MFKKKNQKSDFLVQRLLELFMGIANLRIVLKNGKFPIQEG